MLRQSISMGSQHGFGVPQALCFQDGLSPHNGVGRKMQCTPGISVQHQMIYFCPFCHVQEAETLLDECPLGYSVHSYKEGEVWCLVLAH